MNLNSNNASPQPEASYRKIESVRKAGAKNVFISIFVAASSYCSLILVAKFFGGSLGSDSYFFLVSLSTFASGIIGGAFGTVFLPAFINLFSQSDKEQAIRFSSSIFSWCLTVTVLASIPILIWNEQFFLHISRFNSLQIFQSGSILKYFAPILLFSVLTEFFRVVVLSIGMFTTAAVALIFPSLSLIVFLFAFGHSLHEEALAVSLLFAKCSALAMFVIVLWKAGIRLNFNLANNFHTVRLVKSSAPYLSANIVTSSASFFFDYLGSGLGTGVVTALAFANRVYMLPISVLISPLVEISRTKFAYMQSHGEPKQFNSYYNNFLRLVIYATTPVSVLLFAFNSQIISAMFQRGEFQIESVNIAASCLAIYAVSIPFVSIFLVNGRACESFQRLLWPSIFGTLGNLILITLTFILSNQMGYLGIPFAKIFVDIFYFIPFGFIAFGLFGGKPQYMQIIKSFMFAFLSSMVVMALMRFLLSMYHVSLPFSSNPIIPISLSFFLLYFIIILFFSAYVRAELKAILLLYYSRFFVGYGRES